MCEPCQEESDEDDEGDEDKWVFMVWDQARGDEGSDVTFMPFGTACEEPGTAAAWPLHPATAQSNAIVYGDAGTPLWTRN